MRQEETVTRITSNKLLRQVAAIADAWARKGPKSKKGQPSHRHQQVNRMLEVVAFGLERGARKLEEIGPKTLRIYVKTKGFTPSATTKYRQAMAELMKLSELEPDTFSKARWEDYFRRKGKEIL